MFSRLRRYKKTEYVARVSYSFRQETQKIAHTKSTAHTKWAASHTECNQTMTYATTGNSRQNRTEATNCEPHTKRRPPPAGYLRLRTSIRFCASSLEGGTRPQKACASDPHREAPGRIAHLNSLIYGKKDWQLPPQEGRHYYYSVYASRPAVSMSFVQRQQQQEQVLQHRSGRRLSLFLTGAAVVAFLLVIFRASPGSGISRGGRMGKSNILGSGLRRSHEDEPVGIAVVVMPSPQMVAAGRTSRMARLEAIRETWGQDLFMGGGAVGKGVDENNR